MKFWDGAKGADGRHPTTETATPGLFKPVSDHETNPVGAFSNATSRTPSEVRPLSILQPRLRHVFTVRGVAMGSYVEKPREQVEAICRKRGLYAIPLWRHLTSLGAIRCQTQRLDEVTRTWRQI
jgi:hypothetical protein